jgi:hypothetical protein
MHIQPETARLLANLQSFSGKKLTRPEDLGVLLELGSGAEAGKTLEELAFLAKFLSRTYGILQRIGKDATGYDRLLGEFNATMTKAFALTQDLLTSAPLDVRTRFASTYLNMTQEGLQSFLALLYDLSWYKNWRIDHQRT